MNQMQNIIDHLKLISHMFLKAKDQWRSRAFSKVAGELEIYRQPLTFKNGALCDKIPGVGKAIKDVIEEYVATGTSKKLEKLKKQLPNEVFERFDSKVCKRKVNQLLKPLTEANVDWGYAGSVRRGSSTCKDVDVIVCIKNEKKDRALVERTIKQAGLSADVRNGKEKVGISVPIKSQGRAFTLDLNFTSAEARGAMYLYFTGPKAFNIAQRAHAKAHGLLLNQKGVFKGKKCLASKTEEDMFMALGCDFIGVENRS